MRQQRVAREVATFLAWAAAMGLLVGLTLTGWRPLQAIVGVSEQQAAVIVQGFERRFAGKPKAVARCEDGRAKLLTTISPAALVKAQITSPAAPSLVRLQECEEGFQRAQAAKDRDLTEAEVRKACPLLAEVHELVRQLAATPRGAP